MPCMTGLLTQHAFCALNVPVSSADAEAEPVAYLGFWLGGLNLDRRPFPSPPFRLPFPLFSYSPFPFPPIPSPSPTVH